MTDEAKVHKALVGNGCAMTAEELTIDTSLSKGAIERAGQVLIDRGEVALVADNGAQLFQALVPFWGEGE